MEADNRPRFPLVVGTGAFRTLVSYPVALSGAYGALLALWCLGGRLPGVGWIALAAETAVGLGTYLLFASGLGWTVLFAARLARSVESRACDVVIAPDALLFEGGPHAGARVALDDLDATRTALLGYKLRIASRRGASRIVEVPRDADERASALALADTLSHLGRPWPAAPPRHDALVLQCDACGAPQVPDPGTTTRCTYCGHQSPVPAAIAARIDAAQRVAAARRDDDREITRLLGQRDAARTNRWLVVTGALGGLVLLGAMAAGVGALRVTLAQPLLDPRTPPFGGIGLALFATALMLPALGHLRLADRYAARVLTLRFAATRGPGGADACRACGAPLPTVAPDVLVARCVYCGAASVLGSDLRPAAATLAGAVSSIEHVLVDRTRRLRRSRARIAVAATLLVTAVPIVAWELAHRVA